MPVRSLTQSVWRWPTADQLLEAVQSWAVIQQQWVPSFARVGIFGSYGRGTAGFGSDLDLLLVDEQACDALVLTPAELEQHLTDGLRMAASSQVKNEKPGTLG